MTWYAIPLALQIALILALVWLWDKEPGHVASIRNTIVLVPFLALGWVTWLIAAFSK